MSSLRSDICELLARTQEIENNAKSLCEVKIDENRKLIE